MNTASPDDIDISAVWRSLRRALPKLILLSMVAGGIAYAVLSTFPPRYTSEAQIQVVVPKDGSERSFESVASRLDKEAINTHLRSLSRPISRCRSLPRKSSPPILNSTARCAHRASSIGC